MAVTKLDRIRNERIGGGGGDNKRWRKESAGKEVTVAQACGEKGRGTRGLKNDSLKWRRRKRSL